MRPQILIVVINGWVIRSEMAHTLHTHVITANPSRVSPLRVMAPTEGA